MRRPRRPTRSALPIVDRIVAARPKRKPSGMSAGIYTVGTLRFAHAKWKFGDPSTEHAPWCNVQPPMPRPTGCSCWRSITARTLRHIAERRANA